MKNLLTKAAIASAMLMGVASTANAFVILSLTDLASATTRTCDTGLAVTGSNCNTTYFSLFVNPNKVDFAGVIGAFDISSTTGLSNAPGLPNVATAGTTSLSVHRIGAGATPTGLTVDFVAYGFFNPTGLAKTMQGSASTTAGAGFFNPATEAIFTDFRVDSQNLKTFLGTPSGQASCLMATSENTSCNAGTVAWSDPALGNPGFSTRTQQLFNLEFGSIVSTTSTLTIRNVPEPMTLSLVGVSLLGLAFASRRRAAAKA